MDFLGKKDLVKKLIFIVPLVLLVVYFFLQRTKPPVEVKPPEVEKPTLRFGILPRPEFERANVSEASRPTYTILLEGKPQQELPAIEKVYRLQSLLFGFPSYEAWAKSVAQSLGFKGEGKREGENLFWEEEKKSLSFDLQVLQFTYADKSLGEGEVVTSASEAASVAREFLAEKGLWIKELENGGQEVSFKKIEGFSLKEARSAPEADIFAIDFYPEVENLRVVSNYPQSGLVYVWVRKSGVIRKIVYTFYPIDFNMVATYPIKTLDEVTSDLQNQKGTIVYLGVLGEYPIGAPAYAVYSADINKLELAYFESPKTQKYLQPIYVFKGTAKLSGGRLGEIIIYLPAVSKDWVAGTRD